jgi:uncharacterized protein
MDDSLLEKLRSLGVQFGVKPDPPQPGQSARVPIEVVMDGYDLESPYGTTFLTKQNYPQDHRHGSIDLTNSEIDLSTIFEWAGNSHIHKPALEHLLFIDTETSGLAGGTGTFAFMVGLGYWEKSGFTVTQLFMRDPSEETAMLANLIEITSRFPVIVSFNGKSFDIPLLNSRYVINALTSPFKEIFHIDLLMLSRRIWRNRLSSRTLGSLEEEILKFQRSEEEIPGWMIPDLFFDYLKSGDASPLKGVFYHNNKDIVSLAALLRYLAELLNNPITFTPDEGLDLIAVASLFEKLNRLEEAVHLYEYSIALGLPRQFFIQTLYRYASIRKKAQDWNAAIHLWQQATGYGEVDACIEIAKYHEHRSKNFAEALLWTRKAFECLDISLLPIIIRKQKLKELEHRVTRLQNKLIKESKNDI